jgi:DNA-directed RNA polymerase delta subunit
MSDLVDDLDQSKVELSDLPEFELDASGLLGASNFPKVTKLPFSVLKLPIRVTHALTRYRIRTIGELLTIRSRGFGKVKGLGKKSIDEIEIALVQFLTASQSLTDEDLEFLVDNRPYRDLLKEEVSPQVAGIPISLLKLSSTAMRPLTRLEVNTIGDLIKPEANVLERVRRLGEKPVIEIENALLKLLQDYQLLIEQKSSLIRSSETTRNSESEHRSPMRSDNADSMEKLEQLLDSAPLLIELEDDTVNLLRIIVPLSKTLMEYLGLEREFEVIKRRYGLQNSKLYTLQEIGDYYDITRERVRQLESRAMKKIRGVILGYVMSYNWRVPDVIIKETREILNLLVSEDGILIEQEIMRIFERRYNMVVSAKDINILRFLLNILGIDPLPKMMPGFSGELAPSWVLPGQFDIQTLQEDLKCVYGVIKDTIIPISYFELKIEINRRYRKKIDIIRVRMAAKVCKEIDALDNDIFQIRFEYIPSVAGKAYRILFESQKQLHIRDIWRRINHMLAMAGLQANTPLRTIQQQLASDLRFEHVGRSGLWTLSEWSDIRTENILELMKEFFHLKQSNATPQEVFEYVFDKRADVSKHSVHVYLHSDSFVRVSNNNYELTEWGGKAQKPTKKLAGQEIKELLSAGIKSIFLSKDVKTILLSELVRELVKLTNIPLSTVYMKVVHSTLLEFEHVSAQSRAKVARYVGDNEESQKEPMNQVITPVKKTVAETVQQEVNTYLLKQPDGRALMADIAVHVVKASKCKKPTFYLYLSRMENIEKEYEGKKLYCRIVLEKIDPSLSFPQIDQMEDNVLKEDLLRVVKNLNIDNVDLGLFQLGKIFENELKEFLLEAHKKRSFVVNSKDLDRLVSMIDCVERNGIIKAKHHLTLLREHRNERAHGKIPNKEERGRLLQHAPFLADMYIQDFISIKSSVSRD